MKILRNTGILLLATLACSCQKGPQELVSPNGELGLTVKLSAEGGAGEPVFAINYKGATVVPEVRLGLRTDRQNYADSLKLKAVSEVKAVTDVVVTSTNARQIVESFPEDEKLIFGPDRNLGNYINSITGRNMLLWDGACHVHEKFSVEKILELKRQYPDAQVLVHPECKGAVARIADKVASTAGLLKFAMASDKKDFIVATESGILYEMKKKCPGKNFIPAPPEDSTCACNECNFMRLNTLGKLYNTLKYEWPEVQVEPSVAEKAIRPIERMLEISARLGL